MKIISLRNFPILFIIFFYSKLNANDWKNWLGPTYDGSLENLKIELPQNGQNFLINWQVKVGEGWSSPITYKDFLFLHDRVGEDEIIHCFNKQSGDELWKYSYQSNYHDDFGMDEGPRSTPAICKEIIVTHGPQGRVHALSVGSGELLWEIDLKKEFSSPKGFFGRCSSPLIIEDKVIFDVGGPGAGLIALSITSGDIIWKSAHYGNDYSSVVPYFGREGSMCFAFLRDGFLALDIKTGSRKFFSSFRSPINASVNASSPLIFENKVFVSSCYDVGARVWGIFGDLNKSSLSFKELWQRKGVLDCHFSTPVAKEGFVYGFHGRQERKPVLRCVRLKDAKIMWEANPFGAGNLLRSKEKLIIISENGELLLAKAVPESFNILHRQQILGFESRAHFAISEGCIFARDKRRMISLNLKKFK